MALLVLYDSPAGYGLLQSRLGERDLAAQLSTETQFPQNIVNLLTLKKFYPFESSAKALEEVDISKEGELPPLLQRLLSDVQEERHNSKLAVCDTKLSSLLNRHPEFNIRAVAGAKFEVLFRGLREHFESVFPGISNEDAVLMAVGLGHSLSRHRLKYRSKVVDHLLTHSSKLLEDIDKECNTYSMKIREWYRWHFPEMDKIITDNEQFAKLVLRIGDCSNLATMDLSDMLEPPIEQQLKAAAISTIGIEATPDDVESMIRIAHCVTGHFETRRLLIQWLESRVQAIAPNLTAVVGWLVASKLIAHVGTVMGLAKLPASTIQILGAEKALFKAIKTKHNTPKYGLMYHTSLVGQASGRLKGKIARMLAGKTALAVRVDCLTKGDLTGDFQERSQLGFAWRSRVEVRLSRLDGQRHRAQGGIRGPDGQYVAPVRAKIGQGPEQYNTDADGISV